MPTGRPLSSLRGETRKLQVCWSVQQVCLQSETYERVRNYAANNGLTMSEAGRILITKGLDSEGL